MKRALRKDFLMEIKRSYSRFLSIFFIVALGVAFFSGIQASSPDMRYSGDAYFDENMLMDLKVVGTMGLSQKDIDVISQMEGVEYARSGYGTDVLSGEESEQAVLHMESISSAFNTLTADEGELPQEKGECFLDNRYAERNGYKVGDTITFEEADNELLAEKTMEIVGIGSSPEYISFTRGNTNLGTGEVSGFVYVTEDSFDSEVYTLLHIRVAGAVDEMAFSEEYDTIVQRVEQRLEDLEQERCEIRYEEVQKEAHEELADAQKELDDGKKKAQEQLADARRVLEDAAQQLEDGQKEYDEGVAQIEQAREQLAISEPRFEAVRSQYQQRKTQLDTTFSSLNDRQEALNVAQNQASTLEEHQQVVADQTQLNEEWDQAAAQQEALSTLQEEMNTNEALAATARQIIDQGEPALADASKELEEGREKLKEGQEEYKKAEKEAQEEIADGEKKLADAREELEDLKMPEWMITNRGDLPEYTGYGDNAQRLHNIGQVFPVLFFLVAALISLTTMTRMVEEERTQIGTLKALGYGKGAIAAKFLLYAFLATIGGCVFGVLVGEKILPYIIICAYGIMYQNMHTIVIPYEWKYALMASGAAIFCTMVATISACIHELVETPASLMRPPSPKAGKRVFLERITILWRHLSFTWKATIRNLMRYKKRFFMTIFGIGGCMALLLVGFGLRDSILDIAILQYEDIQRYDGIVIKEDKVKEEDEKELATYLDNQRDITQWAKLHFQKMKLESQENHWDVYLYVPEDVESFSQYITLRDRISQQEYQLNDDGLILSEKTAKLLDVQAGDTIEIAKEGEKGREVVISAICENYMEHYAYMTPTLYQKIFHKEADYQQIMFSLLPEKKENPEAVGRGIMNQKAVLSISYTSSIKAQLDDMLSSLDLVIVVLIVSAGMLAFVVLYNLNNINITERKRELATIKVLGFYDPEVSAYVFRENVILTLLGAVVGCFLGIILHRFIIVTVEVDLCMFGRSIYPASFLYSILFTIAFSASVNLLMHFKLKKIDMVESLKSVE